MPSYNNLVGGLFRQVKGIFFPKSNSCVLRFVFFGEKFIAGIAIQSPKFGTEMFGKNVKFSF